MTRKKFYILLSIELLSIILFSSIDYFNFNSDTFNATGIKVILCWIIVFLGLVLLTSISEMRVNPFFNKFTPTETNFYNLIMDQLESREISEATQKNISKGLRAYLKKRSKYETDYTYSKFFREDENDYSEDHSFQTLSNNIISTFEKKGKQIELLKLICLITCCPLIIAFILNHFRFSKSLFDVTTSLNDSIYIILIFLVLIPLEKWTHFKHRKLLIITLNTFFVILFPKISSAYFSSDSLHRFMNHPIKLIPNRYFLVGYIVITCLAYVAQYMIRKNIIDSIFNGNMLERTI